MSQFFKGIALFVAVTCVVWVVTLWRWQATSRDMTIVDIVVYLGVLPIVVFGLLLALRWAWRGATPRREAALEKAAAKRAQAGQAAPAQAGDEAQRHAVVQLLVAYVGSAAGMSPDDLLTAAADGKPRPDFDDALRDNDGLAVMCARMGDVDADDVQAQLQPIVDAQRAQRAEWAGLEVSEHAQRALAALALPLQSVVQDLRPWSELLGAPSRAAPRSPPDPAGTPASTSMVRVLLGWPAGWNELEQAVAAEWARREVLGNSGDVPPVRFVFAAQAGSGEELWLKADQLLLSLAREGRADLVLVAACHSDLSEPAVAVLEREQRLFSAEHRPKGVMPGEAAAALLLGNAAWPADPEAYLRPARLNRPSVARRDKSIEASGRVGSQTLQEVASQAITAAGLAPDAVTGLVCDADQHTARGTELFGATLALLPQLDPGEDMRLIGTVTGHTGAVNVLLVIAAAAQRARMNDEACLALSVGDTLMRLAVLARPEAEPPAAPPAAA